MSLAARYSLPLILPSLLVLACAKDREPAVAEAPSVRVATPSAGPYRIALIPLENDQIPLREHKLYFRIVDDRIVDDRDAPLARYRIVHEKPLHLIIVRKDLGTFQHVHPEFEEPTRKWIVPLTFESFGPHTLFADFHPDRPGAVPVVVRRDYFVGDTTFFRPMSWSKETLGRQPVDGLDVDVSTPTAPLEEGSEERLRFAWGRPGGGPAVLEPYLGSFGHVVALRAESLDYAHLHPDSASSDPAQGVATFTFHPTRAGAYRVFAQSRVDGKVRTAAVTLLVGEAGPGGHTASGPAGH